MAHDGIVSHRGQDPTFRLGTIMAQSGRATPTQTCPRLFASGVPVRVPRIVLISSTFILPLVPTKVPNASLGVAPTCFRPPESGSSWRPLSLPRGPLQRTESSLDQHHVGVAPAPVFARLEGGHYRVAAVDDPRPSFARARLCLILAPLTARRLRISPIWAPMWDPRPEAGGGASEGERRTGGGPQGRTLRRGRGAPDPGAAAGHGGRGGRLRRGEGRRPQNRGRRGHRGGARAAPIGPARARRARPRGNLR